jgi:hypothetical protein
LIKEQELVKKVAVRGVQLNRIQSNPLYSQSRINERFSNCDELTRIQL